MIDLTTRGRGRPEGMPEPSSVNELIQSRIDGWLSRRDLIRRAAALGIAAPVVQVMLHATSDLVRGAPNRARGARLARFQDGGTVPADKPTAPAGTPQQGGTLVVATTREPDTLHPWLSQLVTTSDVEGAVIDGLFDYDSTQQLVPRLATGFEVSDDGLTYTFVLRSGVTWHNGDPFTAQDVIDSWKMRVNPDFAAYNTLGWDSIVDITSPDGERIVMTTAEIYAPFLSYVAVGYICPSAALAKGVEAFKEEFRAKPYGTGPFRLVEWKPKEQIVLEKFPEYWGTPAKLDRIIYRVLPDDNTQLVQLRTGEVQLCGGSGALTAPRVDEALDIDGLVILEHPTQDWQHLDLKQWDFLRMTKVRQALDFATPTQQIVDRLLQGRGVPAIGDQVPGSWAHNPNIQPRPYDSEQAKALLAEAGLTPGDDGVLKGKVPTTDPNVGDGAVKTFEIELWSLAGEALDEQIVQVIAQSWNAIGVKTETHFQDISTIWGPEGYQFTEKMTACLYTWTNSNDPENVYYWHSSQIPQEPDGTGGNLVGYFHQFAFQAEIDDLTQRAVTTLDQEERQQLYWQIQEVLHREVPVIFLYWPKIFPAARANIGGFWPSAFNYLTWNAFDWYLTE